jgi:hypothetical protein
MRAESRRRRVGIRSQLLSAIIIGAALIAGAIAPAAAANWFEMNFWLSGPRYDRVVPLCEEPGPLNMIARRFAEKERRFWNSALEIVGFEGVRETRFHPWHSETIPRRFCRATVLVNDGRKRPLLYWIGEDTGIIGATYGVEWCVVGLDRNWAYSPGCKMAQP